MQFKQTQTSLQASEFPINELVPVIQPQTEFNNDNYDLYNDELERHPTFQGFGYYVNETREAEGAPKALVFQGSYMNSYGYKFLANAFSEYVLVHDYQNVIDFSYYFNIFQPDCVIFEVAEWTFDDFNFNYNNMKAMDLNPTLQVAENQAVIQKEDALNKESITVEKGDVLTKIHWAYSEPVDYAWLRLNQVYDMKKSDIGYEVTVHTKDYERYADDIQIIILSEDTLTTFSF